MRLGIMQPYFFPYLGYYSLMMATDRWIVFDTAQYIRHGWVNRNRVLTKGKDDWKYVRIPVAKCPQATLIRDVQIAESSAWRSDLIRSLDYYRDQRAPFYAETCEFLEGILDASEMRLAVLLAHTLKKTSEYLGLATNISVFSEMDLRLDSIAHAGQWALRISEAVGATAYINAPGGREIFVPSEFEAAGIELKFLQPNLRPYDQRRENFVSGLSVIDAMMWNSRDEVRSLIGDYQLTA